MGLDKDTLEDKVYHLSRKVEELEQTIERLQTPTKAASSLLRFIAELGKHQGKILSMELNQEALALLTENPVAVDFSNSVGLKRTLTIFGIPVTVAPLAVNESQLDPTRCTNCGKLLLNRGTSTVAPSLCMSCHFGKYY